MGTFTLDVSKLGGGLYNTIPFRMIGEFRDLQLRWSQSVASQDLEAHYLELHFGTGGGDENPTS